jgi:hypothetical protein
MLTLTCWEKQGFGLAALSIALGFIERMRTSQVALASKIQPHSLLSRQPSTIYSLRHTMAILEDNLWLLLSTLALAILFAGWVRSLAVIENTDRRHHELEVLYDPECSADIETGKARSAIVEYVLRSKYRIVC